MTITVRHKRRSFRLDAPRHTISLAELIWLRGPLSATSPARGLCLGIGLCGRCRVRFLSSPPPPGPAERRVLTPEELAAGIRLACRRQAEDGMELEIPDATANERENIDALVPAGASPRIDANNAPNDIFLAVDLGTTSLAWQAGDRRGHRLNPQGIAGGEVMSRLALAEDPANALRLRDLVLNSLRDLVRDLEADGGTVCLLGLAANPAVCALALGLDGGGLRAAPYRLDYAGGRLEYMPGLPPIWTAPHISPFVGGDLSAGLVSLLDKPRPFLLADMGTNGEFLLLHRRDGKDALLAASVPLGPALEGVGMRCGALAGPGIVSRFYLGPQGLLSEIPSHASGSSVHAPARPPEDGERREYGAEAQGISAAGYLSLLSILLDLGLVGTQGNFIPHAPPHAESADTPHGDGLRARLARNLRQDKDSGEWRLELGQALYLSAGDVENLLKVKAAFSLALAAILRRAGLVPEDLDALYLAGALGRHAPLPALERLGFLSPALARRSTAVGNAALEGMNLLLRARAQAMGMTPGANQGADQCANQGSDTGRDAGRDLPPRMLERCEVLDLTSDPAFYQQYVQAMHFPLAQDLL